MKIKDLYLYWIGISGLIGFSAGMLFALLLRERTASQFLVIIGILSVVVVWLITILVVAEKHNARP